MAGQGTTISTASGTRSVTNDPLDDLAFLPQPKTTGIPLPFSEIPGASRPLTICDPVILTSFHVRSFITKAVTR